MGELLRAGDSRDSGSVGVVGGGAWGATLGHPKVCCRVPGSRAADGPA